ncbi:HAD family hydrolase [Streptomyces sp. MI02-7b]|uniref:HAD family hydrolase n=1 Tax=Streptomyces sp. MI02-7b TaxID=462941 RepID=UPI0029A7BE84|nr:haloacid dehalogenase-like hydrolase [Streptomyces sp. MI02-7b]MDX3075817.1 haloacid dehalogenase-like hydrolase [Streptomyces sp. MI02-7b]
MTDRRFVLWDIDHTLIDTRGVGRELSAAAFEQVTGQPMREQAKIDGITEPVIFRETARLHGLQTGRADFERFARALADGHLAHSSELRERGHALPGAAAALDALAGVPGLVQTVVSGNVRAVAEIKLNVFGLDRHIAWDLGAYGEDNDERPGLVRTALARLRAKFGAVDPSEAVVIGDTAADVAAALDNCVAVLAVATGRTSADDLRAAGADLVVPDLTHTASVVQRVQALLEG